MHDKDMANGYIPESSLLLGIIPALVTLYYSVKYWNGKYSEKTLFIMFILGIFIGFIIAVVQSQIAFNLEFLILYPFLEQIVKTIILNLKRFHDKKETVLYGLALGLGFGSIYPPASLLILSNQINSTLSLLLILMGSIGLVFLHGVTGALIGFGIYQRKLAQYYLFAVLILIAANIIRLDYQLQWINLVFGILLFWYIHSSITKKTISITKRLKR